VRIALVHSYYSSRVPSGENSVVDAQVDVLRAAGHEVRVVGQSTDQRLRRRSYPIEAALTAATGFGPNPLDELHEFGPDVVHVHNLFPNFGRRWLSKWKGPLVATLHNYRPLCPAASLYRDGHVCTDCPSSGSTRHAVRHRCFHRSSFATLPVALGTRFADDPLLQRADVLTTLSSGMSEVYAEHGVPAHKLTVLDNFVAEAPAGPGGDSWLYAGRIERDKGLHALIERWPTGHRLIVAGVEDESDPLPPHPDVEPVGRIPHDELVDLMGGSLGLVFPSIWLEGLALVCLEALSVGTPVLTFDDIPAGRSVTDLGVGLAGGRGELPALLERAAESFPALRDHCRSVQADRFTSAAWLSDVEVIYARAMA
jgi:glycosyltransferase involved in cell wall biosynthesis